MMNKSKSHLNVFIMDEIESSQNRIAAVNAFISAINMELYKYIINPILRDSDRFREMTPIFKSMLRMYHDEIISLKYRREKMIDYILSIKNLSISYEDYSDNDIFN